MQRIVGMALSLFILLFCFSLGAQAMPPQGHPAIGKSLDMAAEKARDQDLVVTLEYSRKAPWLAGFSHLEEGKGPEVTLKVPVAEKKFADLPMALVDGKPFTVGDFHRALASTQTDEGDVVSVEGQNPQVILERLINSRVFIADAHETGIDELPDVRKFIRSFEHQTLRGMLVKKVSAGVKADPKAVKGLYRDAIKEYKIKAVLFQKDELAKAFVSRLKKGENFDKAAKQAIANNQGILKGGREGKFFPRSEMSPALAGTIDGLKKGQVSAVIPNGKQFVVVKLLGTRSKDDPKAMAEAREKARNYAQNMAIVAYVRKTTKKYVKLDQKLFDSLDFAKNINALVKDKRVLATIKGTEPVTIADIAQALRSRYFHGFDRAVKEGKIPKDKIKVLNQYIGDRVLLQDALAQRLDKTKEYKRRTEDYSDAMVFGVYMRKVLAPKVKITMDDLRDYYKKHEDKYKTPRMLSIQSLVFKDEKDARDALEKLRKGTEINWLETNSPGQVSGKTSNLLDFGNGLITTDNLPDGVRNVLEKVSAGEARLYDDGQGHYYVLYVKRLVPERKQPFKMVQSDILNTLSGERIKKVMAEWGKKLRQAYQVEIFAKDFSSTKL